MKQNESLQHEERESITASVVQRKWLALQQKFKHYYYAAVDPEARIDFPYYESMHNLFTDFATRKLNEKNATLGLSNTTTAADITNYVAKLLDESRNDEETSPALESCNVKSRASTICQKLSVMPKESVCIHAEKLRIEPNTPFNSRYQLKTILSYHNPRLLSLNKRSLTSDYECEPIIKKRSQPFNDNREITTIEANDESVDYQVEALDESNMELTVETISDSSAAASSTLMSSKQAHSVLDVPSYADDEESLDGLRAYQNIQNAKVSIISDETLRVTASHTNTDEPPVWFQSFLSKYDADVNKLFSRIDEIDTKLNRFLASRPSVQQSQAAQPLSRVTKFKRES